MTEEQLKQKFKETYPEYMCGDTPLSPYWDIWCYAIEIAEKETQEQITRLENKVLEMRRCTNCDHHFYIEDGIDCNYRMDCNNYSRWKMKV